MRWHIFAKTHISHFSAYSGIGIFKIVFAQIMPHMPHIQKFAYIRTYAAYFRICDRIFSAFFVQLCYKTLKYFGGKRLPVFTIRR